MFTFQLLFYVFHLYSQHSHRRPPARPFSNEARSMSLLRFVHTKTAPMHSHFRFHDFPFQCSSKAFVSIRFDYVFKMCATTFGCTSVPLRMDWKHDK
jgi:hypothetical protein